jgi:tetratricopeptide (TPR) repeat protein
MSPGSDPSHPRPAPSAAPKQERAAPPEVERSRAERQLDLLSEELAGQPDPSRAGRLHYEMARVYEWPARDLDAAAKHYLQALALCPDHLPTMRGARRVLSAKREYGAVLPLFDGETRLVREPAHKATLLYEKGRMLEDALGQLEEARDAYAAAVALDERNSTYLSALERAQTGLSEWDRVQQTLGREAVVVPEPRQQAVVVSERARLVEVRKSDARAATELYQVALGLDDSAPEALAALKRLHHAHGRWSDLAAVLRLEAERSEDPALRSAAFYVLGRVLNTNLGRVDEALDAFERASQASPRDLMVLGELERLYERAQRWRDLASVLERIALLTERPSERAVLLHRLGSLQEERVGDEDAAISAYGRALGVEPAHPPSIDALCALLTRRQKWAELVAMRLGEAGAVDEPSRRAGIHERIAAIFEHKLDSADMAAEHHAKALAVLPGYPPAFKALCRIYQAAGKHRELIAVYESAISEASDDATRIAFLFKIGAVLEDALQTPDAAVAVYRRILELAPGDLGAIHALERAAERAKQWDPLIAALELEARTVQGKGRVAPLFVRAGEVAADEIGDLGRAAELFTQAVEVDGSHRPALAGLSSAYHRAGRWEELLQVYARELELEPGAAGVALCHQIGDIEQRRTGRKDQAIAWYLRALERDSRHEPSLSALERILADGEKWSELGELLTLELSALTDAEQRARVAFRLGELYEHQLAQPEQALAAYDEAIQALPALRAARDARLRLLHARDKKRLCDELAAEASAASDPARVIAFQLQRAELLRDELGDEKRAVEAFEAVLALSPAHLGALRALGRLHDKLGDVVAQARVLAAEADAQQDPAMRVGSLRRLAHAEERTAELAPRARNTYLRILEISPTDALALAALERLALGDIDPQLLELVDSRLGAGAAPAALVGAHRTRLGEGFERSGDPRSLETYRSAMALDLKDVGAAWGIVRLAEPSGEPRLLAEAAELSSRILLRPAQSARMLLRAAEILAKTGDARGASTALARGLELYPDDPDVANRLHAALVEQGEIQRAIDVLSRAAGAASTKSRLAELWLMVAGLFSERRNDAPAALATLRRAAEHAPDHLALRRELVRLLVVDRQWAAAVAELERLLALRPPDDVALAAHLERAGILLQHLRDPGRAEKHVDAVLSARPNDPNALQLLIEIQRSTGRLDAAEETTERLLEVATAPEMRADAFARRARLLKAKGEIGEAADAYVEAVALAGLAGRYAEEHAALLAEIARSGAKPPWEGYTSALNRRLSQVQSAVERTALQRELARVYADELRTPERAIEALASALASDPTDVALRLELAARLLRSHQYASAEEHLRRLVERDATRAEVWRYLVEACRALGRPGDALLATAPLAALGFASEAEKSALAAQFPRPALGAHGAFDVALVSSLAPSADRDLAGELLAASWECVSKLFPPDLERWGLLARDRLTSRSGHPLRALADRVAGVFGGPEFDLYVHRGPSSDVTVELAETPALMLPAHLARGSESAQVFLLARPIANVARRLHAVHRLGPVELELALAAVVRSVVPSYGAGLADPSYLDNLARQVGRVISRRERRLVEELAPHYAVAPRIDFGAWRQRVLVTSTRAALVLSDDLPSAVALTRSSDGESGALVQELLHFWVGDVAKALRRRLTGI